MLYDNMRLLVNDIIEVSNNTEFQIILHDPVYLNDNHPTS